MCAKIIVQELVSVDGSGRVGVRDGAIHGGSEPDRGVSAAEHAAAARAGRRAVGGGDEGGVGGGAGGFDREPGPVP